VKFLDSPGVTFDRKLSYMEYTRLSGRIRQIVRVWPGSPTPKVLAFTEGGVLEHEPMSLWLDEIVELVSDCRVRFGLAPLGGGL
jgi:hypothetical protein